MIFVYILLVLVGALATALAGFKLYLKFFAETQAEVHARLRREGWSRRGGPWVALVLLGACRPARVADPGNWFSGRIQYLNFTGGGAPPTITQCVAAGRRLICENRIQDIRMVIASDDATRSTCEAFTPAGKSTIVMKYAYDDRPVGVPRVSGPLSPYGAQMIHGPFVRTGRELVFAGRKCTEWHAQSKTISWTACIDPTIPVGVTEATIATMPTRAFDGLPPGLVVAEDFGSLEGDGRFSVQLARIDPADVYEADFAACPTRD